MSSGSSCITQSGIQQNKFARTCSATEIHRGTILGQSTAWLLPAARAKCKEASQVWRLMTSSPQFTQMVIFLEWAPSAKYVLGMAKPHFLQGAWTFWSCPKSRDPSWTLLGKDVLHTSWGMLSQNTTEVPNPSPCFLAQPSCSGDTRPSFKYLFCSAGFAPMVRLGMCQHQENGPVVRVLALEPTHSNMVDGCNDRHGQTISRGRFGLGNYGLTLATLGC